jgi:hypothetical protein
MYLGQTHPTTLHGGDHTVKKFLSIVASATLLGSGLVAGTATSASADCGDYPSCIDTDTIASALNNPREGNVARVEAKVVANSDRRPTGKIIFTYKKKSNGDVVDVFRRDYDGGREEYAFGGLPQGRYKVIAQFRGDWRFENSRDTFEQRVRPAA